MPIPIQTVAYSMPLAYSVDALRQAMSGSINTQMFLIDLAVQILYSLVFLVAAIQLLKKTIE